MATTVRTRRYAAAFLDGLLAFTVSLLPVALVVMVGGSGSIIGRLFGVGLGLGTAYLLLRDAIPYAEWGTRSLGKRWLGIRPFTVDGEPIDRKTSVRRNATLAAASGLAALNYVIGGFKGVPFFSFFLVLALGLIAVEAILVGVDAEGARLGDRWAGTRVTEARA